MIGNFTKSKYLTRTQSGIEAWKTALPSDERKILNALKSPLTFEELKSNLPDIERLEISVSLMIRKGWLKWETSVIDIKEKTEETVEEITKEIAKESDINKEKDVKDKEEPEINEFNIQSETNVTNKTDNIKEERDDKDLTEVNKTNKPKFIDKIPKPTQEEIERSLDDFFKIMNNG